MPITNISCKYVTHQTTVIIWTPGSHYQQSRFSLSLLEYTKTIRYNTESVSLYQNLVTTYTLRPWYITFINTNKSREVYKNCNRKLNIICTLYIIETVQLRSVHAQSGTSWKILIKYCTVRFPNLLETVVYIGFLRDKFHIRSYSLF